MIYYIDKVNNPYNNIPLRVLNEELFVVDDLIRLTGLDGMSAALLKLVLKFRRKLDCKFYVKEFKMRALEGFEERGGKRLCVDKATACYILDRSVIDAAITGHGYEYNEYTQSLSNWFKERFKLNEYETQDYKSLLNSLVVTEEDRGGTDFMNYMWGYYGI